MDRRPSWRTLLAVGVCLVLGGCAGGGDNLDTNVSESEAAQPIPGDWILVSYLSEPDSMNRIIATNTSAAFLSAGAMGSFISEHLLRYDSESWRLERPILAESYPGSSTTS